MEPILIKEARYLDGYKVELIFNDHKKKVIDLKNFLSASNHPQYKKYKKIEHFKKFKIENGNIVWGKDWDMIFPLFDLYEGKLI